MSETLLTEAPSKNFSGDIHGRSAVPETCFFDLFTAANSGIEPVGESVASSEKLPIQSSFRTIANMNGSSSPVSVDYARIPIAKPKVSLLKERFQALQRWHGSVTEVTPDSFWAR